MTVRNTNQPQKTAIVWTKSENRDGIKAAALLRRTGAKVEVRDINSGKWKKSDVEASVPGYTTLPQVVVDGTVVGDITALKEHPDFLPKLKQPTLSKEERSVKTLENRTNMRALKLETAAARSLISNTTVRGRQFHPTAEQKTAALARAEAAKAIRDAKL
jgi:glutaredoxin